MNIEQTPDQIPPGSSELLHFRGTRPLFAEEVRTRVAAGARCVRFEFCLSFLFFTVRRHSAVYLTTSWQQRYLWGVGYSVLALALGPWGVPWGVIWTPRAIWVNLTGGTDCTQEVLAALDSPKGEFVQRSAQPGEVRVP